METNTITSPSPTEESQEGRVGSSVMVLGTLFSYPYYRKLCSRSDPFADVNVLNILSWTPQYLPTLNEQTKRELLILYEKEIEMLEQKLKHKKDLLSSIKNSSPPLPASPLQHQWHSPVMVHAQLVANLAISVPPQENHPAAEPSVNPAPTYTELVNMSTIVDQGTGQIEPLPADDGPSLTELLKWSTSDN